MAKYSIDISDAPKGAYARVKSALGKTKHTYSKPVFSFEGDAALFEAVSSAAAGTESKPKKAAKPKKAKAPKWLVSLDGAEAVAVHSELPPNACLTAAEHGASTCTVADANGSVVASWSA